ncbi:MAG: hypothetical protein ACI9BO_001620 [Zhongshania sp.]|jgi:uncharacterized protein with NRDE domain
MCLILLSWLEQNEFPLIVAANRDEFFKRPTLAADFWPDQPQILAGRDLEYGGSWLGISRNGRFAAVTNLRNGDGSGELSRGNLVKDFLLSKVSSVDFLSELEATKFDYRPFNFLACDGEQLAYSNNTDLGWHTLEKGHYAIGNIPLSQSHPKTQLGIDDLKRTLANAADYQHLLAMLGDRQISDAGNDALLQALSSRFVSMPGYGTRSSSIVMCRQNGGWDFWEQLYACKDGEDQHPQSLQHFRFEKES